jgi:ABC-2 type transport system ATP-binding protein
MRMENPPQVAELMKIQGVTKVDFLTDKQIRVYFDGDEEITERLISAGVQQQWQLREVNLEKGLLDDIFKQLSSPSAHS